MTRGRNGRQQWRLDSHAVTVNGTTVLILEGRLGHASAGELKAIVEGAANASKEVVLDLAAVDYLSSAALKVIEAIAAEQAERGGALALRSPSPAARLSLELAGLNAMLQE